MRAARDEIEIGRKARTNPLIANRAKLAAIEAKREAAKEEKRKKREEAKHALTEELCERFYYLEHHYKSLLQYEKLTELARTALTSKPSDLELAHRYGGRRLRLRYVPPEGYSCTFVFAELCQLKEQLRVRYKVLHRQADEGKNITYAALCQEYIDDVQRLLDMKMFSAGLLSIPWSQLTTASSSNVELGKGANGTVYKMTWRQRIGGVGTMVAVKISVRTRLEEQQCLYDQELRHARLEAERIVEVSKRGGQAMADLIVQVYGFVEGPLPDSLTALFKLRKGEEAFGVVMRLEGGGSLDNLLHPPPDVTTHITLPESVRLLSRVIESLAVLHSYGVVHGDLKPENVLLNDKQPPDPRIGDFGLSELRENALQTLQQSTVQKTSKAKGTPVYMAPEMLYENHGLLAKATRSTDMYAFALLAYEVLSRCRPFDGLGLGALTMKVCSGERPPLDKLPSDTPQALKDMIERCWDSDRNKRLSAVECYAIVSHVHSDYEQKLSDICLSVSLARPKFISHLHNLLSKAGYRVYIEPMESEVLSGSMQQAMASCKAVIACVDSSYQTSPKCMDELRYARNLPSIPVIGLFVEDNFFGKLSDELKDLLEVLSTGGKMFIDVGDIAIDPGWDERDASNDTVMAMLHQLASAVEPLMKLLDDLGCKPSKAPLPTFKLLLGYRWLLKIMYWALFKSLSIFSRLKNKGRVAITNEKEYKVRNSFPLCRTLR